jgi:glycosyltransferase involved in cell wall biosynthesis
MSRPLRIALIADTFPPLRTSGAVQLRDLSIELVRQGHHVTVMLPAPSLNQSWALSDMNGVRVLRLKAPQTKDISYVRRTMAEFLMPFAMKRQLHNSPLAEETWDGVAWYSPSIFHGPFVNSLKRANKCKSYLIIRDIFPEWAVDMGLMGRGLPYKFFDAVARYQYSVADVIGVQTPGNLSYFKNWQSHPKRQLEVLPNWLDQPVKKHCSIRINETTLAGRMIFIYAGNMGVAEGMEIMLDLAHRLVQREEIGFMFVGRGSEVARIKSIAHKHQLTNVLFFDEIDSDEIPDLYSQCSAGLMALDSRHKSHNIPGKFLTYMQCGLPVLANVNSGNDLVDIIRSEQVGYVCESNQIEELLVLANQLIEKIQNHSNFSLRCQALFQRNFSVERVAKQIVSSMKSVSSI